MLKNKLLSKKEEYDLIKQWQELGNKKSLDKIIKSFKRMAVSYAKRYSKYGVSREELVHEGIIGIIHAVNKFDLKKDLRLATYASWWIRAAMQDYILKNWSVVKIGSTAAQKMLFFGFNKIKNKIASVSQNYMTGDQIDFISKNFKIKSKSITDMESKITLGDLSLNQTYNSETENDFLSNLKDEKPNPEDIVSGMKDNLSRSRWLKHALESLNNREKEIVERKLYDKPLTLEILAKKIGVSKERIRQIENKAYKKLSKKLLLISGQDRDFFINN